MKLIIDIDKKWEAKCSWFSDRDIKDYLYSVCRNGTPIPDNATNGDVIKVMFSNSENGILYNTVFTDIDNGSWFALDWWNAPYQKGGK